MRGPLGLYRVAGTSMLPAYDPGDLLVAMRVPGRRSTHASRWLLTPGRAVVVRRPERVLVKRLVRREQGGWWVQGDAADASTDSRAFGVVPQAQVEAVVLGRLARAPRAAPPAVR